MRGLTGLLLFGLVLAACSPSDETAADETTTTADEVTTTSGVEETSTTQATTTTTEATTTTAAASGADCLVGEWELDSEAFVEQLTTAMAEEVGGQDITIEFVGGSYTVSMGEGGTFTAVRDEWSWQTAMAEGTFRITIDGIDTATWSADAGSLTVSDIESSSVVTAQAEVEGELVDLPQSTVPLADTNAVGETTSYTCTGDTLTVESTEGFTSELTRVGG